MIAVTTHIPHHPSPPIVTPNSHNRDTAQRRWDKSTHQLEYFWTENPLLTLLSCIHTCTSSKHNGRPRGVLDISLHLSHQHVHRVDDPRNVPQYGQQEVDPELHLQHPSKLGEEHNTLAAYVLDERESCTYAAAVAQEDADRREEDGEEHLQERRRRHSLRLSHSRLLSLEEEPKNRPETACLAKGTRTGPFYIEGILGVLESGFRKE